jgi:peptide/nickel transport system substrate-binding protein/oligopeptide transport system substrate-binding protein
MSPRRPEAGHKGPLPAVGRLALAAALAMTCCGQQRQTPNPAVSEQPRDGGTFRMAQDAPDRLDPACVDDVYEATIVNQIFNGLLSFDTHLNTVPGVASSWIISPDGTVYTFHLRKSVRFHDGSLLTADDVVYSLTRVFDLPQEQSGLAREYLSHIQGSEEYARREAASITGLVALSPTVVRITLRQPYASFLAVLASELARIVPKAYVERVGATEFASHPVGCGPFQFDSWAPQRIVLIRFASYFGARAHLDSIVYELPEENARDYAVSRFVAGALSAAVVPDGRLGELQARPATRILTRQELSLQFIGLNLSRPPFDDVRVRQAFAHAIDRDALVRAEPGGRIPPNGILPPGMPGFTPEPKVLQRDLDRARELLAQAGFAGGQGLPPIVYTTASPSEQARKLFESIRSQVAEIGFDLRSEQLTWRQFSQRLTEQKLQCFTVTWVADIPDPDSFLYPMCHSRGSANFTAYSSGQIDALLGAGRAMRSSAERLRVYREAESLVLQEASLVPLYHPLSVIAVQQDVRGLNVTPMGVGSLPIDKVWLAAPGDQPRMTAASLPILLGDGSPTSRRGKTRAGDQTPGSTSVSGEALHGRTP